MTTPRDLIKGALQLIGVIGAAEDIDGDQVTDLFARLNRMIGALSAEGDLIYADTEVTKVLTSGDYEYTIGSGADINTVKPVNIKTATYTSLDGVDTEIRIVDEAFYASIPKKNTLGIPEYLYYKTGHPTGTIRLYPSPSEAGTLTLGVHAPLTQFTGLSQTVSLPEGYEEAIEYNYARRVCGIYGKTLTMEQSDIADKGLRIIKAANRATDSMEARILGPGQRNRGYDIRLDG